MATDKQHSYCLRKQGRRHEVWPTVYPSLENPDLMLQEAGNSQSLRVWLNVLADKLSRLGEIIQTKWSFLPEVFQLICTRWHQPQKGFFQVTSVCVIGSRPLSLGSLYTWSTLGGPGTICFPTSSNSGQGGGKAKRLPITKNH